MERKLVLQRFDSGDQGTFGRLLRWYTLECPWRENASNISCIPSGTYKVIWAVSPRYKRSTLRLVGTAPRAGILIHSANYAGDTTKGLRSHLNGCIALGERVGWMDGQKAVLVSRPAVSALEDMMRGKTFQLEVRDA